MNAETPRRILFVTHTAEWIGPNISLVELVTRLPASLSPLVVLPGDGPLRDVLEEKRVPLRSLSRLDKWGILPLSRIIRRDGISLVYGNSASGVSKNALIAAKLTRRPFIYHLRETASTTGWTNFFLRHADSVIAVSNATASSYAAFLRSPATVVYNGVPLERFSSFDGGRRERIRSDLGLSPGDRVIIHVGNVYPRKGQLLAVNVFSCVVRSIPFACLLLVGRMDRDPEYVKALRLAIETAEQPRRIVLAGFRNDVHELLSASDVFLHTATGDPHPRAVIEAMAASLPVVAISVDGVAESVVNDETGFLVSGAAGAQELAQPVIRLLMDDELRHRLGTSGQRRARELFSAPGTARQIARVINDTIEVAGG